MATGSTTTNTNTSIMGEQVKSSHSHTNTYTHTHTQMQVQLQGHKAMELVHGHHWSQAITILDTLVTATGACGGAYTGTGTGTGAGAGNTTPGHVHTTTGADGQDTNTNTSQSHSNNQDHGPAQWLAARGQCHMQLGSMHLAVRDCAMLLQLCYKKKRPLPEAGRDLLIAARTSPHSLSPALAPILNQLNQLDNLHQQQQQTAHRKQPDQLNQLQHQHGMQMKNVMSQSRSQNQTPPPSVRSSCTYCALTFSDRAALRAHCATEDHQRVIMSDEGRDWKCRPPPRGFASDAYVMCENWESTKNNSEGGTCAYGAQCVEAHGPDELTEWKERFEYRKMKLQRASEKELYGKSYTGENTTFTFSDPLVPEEISRQPRKWNVIDNHRRISELDDISWPSLRPPRPVPKEISRQPRKWNVIDTHRRISELDDISRPPLRPPRPVCPPQPVRPLRFDSKLKTSCVLKHFSELLLEKWVQATSPEKIMREKLPDVVDTCSSDLITTISSKVSTREWTFSLKTRQTLRAVALLQDAHRNHFVLKNVSSKKLDTDDKSIDVELDSVQEWTSSIRTDTVSNKSLFNESNNDCPLLEHNVRVIFSTDIYGTFRQSVVFDFGVEPVLVKHLCVDVVPVTDADKVKEVCEEMKLSTAERWDEMNSDIVPFSSPVYPGLSTPYGKEVCSRDRELLNVYPAPRTTNLCLTQTTITEKRLTKNNYRTRMHELLYVEEIARCEQVAKFNITCKFRVVPSYILSPSGMAASTAKYAHSGELFALLPLGADVSEDTPAGRLILNTCTTILFSKSPYTGSEPRRVYEAFIEDKGKKMIYLRLSAISVQELEIKADTDFQTDIQFQLNRLTFCEWHYAIDKISDYSLIFPDTMSDSFIPWSPHHQWKNSNKCKLNIKQKEAVMAITCHSTTPIPPILIIGPFGTGKTYTLSRAIKQLLLQSDSKILICTHSNSAADLYIKDYLHPWLEEGVTDAKPLRVYYHKRWVTTVDQTVQKYCLIELNNGVRNFKLPTLEDVMKHRIVVVTLSISMYLSTLGLPKGFFTHILLDEAAQAMESEALMPLALATPMTRIVLAGDHMQLSPELFSDFAKERNLHVSLLERLYDHYPTNFPCKILLCKNYRAHEAIINFTSELFYDQMLIASGKQPAHEKFYPLTFFTTRGEDIQDQNSTAFYNNSEVYELVERISELKKKWPVSWGKIDEHSIGIMTPYADQVFRIRSELRKRRMGGISVERVLNVQGKQFRAVFLSTVRTRRTCQVSSESDYGFLSNRKLLNTAITRAQSLVAVVGDPVALCSIGKCRKVWERFISTCEENKSLFGISWSMLRSQLDGVELKKTYTLNPLAKEFVPRSMQKEAYLKFHPIPGPQIMASILGPPLQMSVNQNNTNNVRQNIITPQMPPMLNTTNPILPPYLSFSAPFFFPTNPNPTNTQNMFPMNQQPTQPQAHIQNIPVPFSPPVNQSGSPWRNSFPLTSSPNSKNAPNWTMKQIQNKSTIPPNNTQGSFQHHENVAANMAPRPNLVPSHIVNSPNLNVQNKAHTFLPLPPNMTTHSNSDSLPVTQNIFSQENFMQNDISQPQTPFRNPSSNMIQDRIHNFLPLQNKLNENNSTNGKMQIRFLENVHFPEKVPTSNQQWKAFQGNEHFQTYNIQELNLGTNIQDLSGEHRDNQSQLHRHVDMQGLDILKMPDSFNRLSQTDFNRMSEELLSEQKHINNSQFLNYNMVNGHQHEDSEKQWNNTVENHNQLMGSTQSNKEFESFAAYSNTRDDKPFENFSDFSNELSWLSRPSNQSVPLYRRRGTNQPNNTSSEKQNNSTGAFAGYAKAFSLQQSEPNSSLHNPLPVHGRLIMNGNLNINSNMVDRQAPFNNMLNPQQRLHQQIHPEFNHITEPMERYNLPTTYASVLRQPTPKLEEEKNDPFMMMRDFDNKSQPHGLYNYFN